MGATGSDWDGGPMQFNASRGPSPMQRNTPSRNIAARAGHWSATHRKTAIFGWLGFVIIALVLGMGTGMKEPASHSGPGEAGRAGAAIDRAFPKDDGAGEQVLVQKR